MSLFSDNLKSFVVVVEREADRSGNLLGLNHRLEVRQQAHVFRHVRRQNLYDALPRTTAMLQQETGTS